MSAAPESGTVRERARHPDEETRYRAVAALAAGDALDLAVLLERIGDPSWRVRTAAVERLASVEDPRPVIAPLLDALAAGASIGARQAAAAALGRIGGAAVPGLVAALSAPEPDVREAAAGCLAAVRDRRAVPALAARLADPDPNVRGAAAEALGQLGGAEATAALLAGLESDDGILRLGALEGLALVGAAPCAARIAAVLPDRALRRAAYQALGASDEPAALALLAAGLAEPSRATRRAVLGAIGRLRMRRSAAALAPLAAAVRASAAAEPGLADACAEALAADDPPAAIGALVVLGASGRAEHAAAVARLAEDDRYRTFVEEALDALPPTPAVLAALGAILGSLSPVGGLAPRVVLSRAGVATAFDELVRAASDPDPRLQAEAIGALARIGDGRAVVPLAGLLGDDAPGAAALAATALARLAARSDEVRARVREACRARAGTRPSAALYRVLGAAGEARDVALLRAGLRAPSVAQRAAAAAAVGALAARGDADAASIPELAAALSDPAPDVRAAGARAIGDAARGRAAAGDALAALRAVARDRDPDVQAAAIEALASCGDAGAVDAEARLRDASALAPQVAVSVLRALARTGQLAASFVSAAARHPDPEVVKEAVATAARLPGPDGEAIVRAAAESGCWDVRRAAAHALRERGDAALAPVATRLAATEPDPLVARAFADAARALGGG